MAVGGAGGKSVECYGACSGGVSVEQDFHFGTIKAFRQSYSVVDFCRCHGDVACRSRNRGHFLFWLEADVGKLYFFACYGCAAECEAIEVVACGSHVENVGEIFAKVQAISVPPVVEDNHVAQVGLHDFAFSGIVELNPQFADTFGEVGFEREYQIIVALGDCREVEFGADGFPSSAKPSRASESAYMCASVGSSGI